MQRCARLRRRSRHEKSPRRSRGYKKNRRAADFGETQRGGREAGNEAGNVGSDYTTMFPSMNWNASVRRSHTFRGDQCTFTAVAAMLMRWM